MWQRPTAQRRRMRVRWKKEGEMVEKRLTAAVSSLPSLSLCPSLSTNCTQRLQLIVRQSVLFLILLLTSLLRQGPPIARALTLPPTAHLPVPPLSFLSLSPVLLPPPPLPLTPHIARTLHPPLHLHQRTQPRAPTMRSAERGDKNKQRRYAPPRPCPRSPRLSLLSHNRLHRRR